MSVVSKTSSGTVAGTMVSVPSPQQLGLILAFLPVAAAMQPQWRGLVNGTVIYLALGTFALFFVVCISKPNKPCVPSITANE